MKQILLILIFILTIETVYSQNNSQTEISSLSLEEFLESFVAEDGDLESLLNLIDFYTNNPIIFAKSNANQIAQIPGISYFEAVSINDILKKNPIATEPKSPFTVWSDKFSYRWEFREDHYWLPAGTYVLIDNDFKHPTYPDDVLGWVFRSINE